MNTSGLRPTATRPNSAATGTTSARVRFATLTTDRRNSLITDARILRARGLTIPAIAHQLGVGVGTISRWLQG